MSFSVTSLWLLLVNQVGTSFQLLILHVPSCCHAHHHDGHGIMSPELNGFFFWVSLVPVPYHSNRKETKAAGEGTYHQAWFLKLGSGRRGRTPTNCLQTCTRASWHTCTYTYINKSMNLNKTYFKNCLKGP